MQKNNNINASEANLHAIDYWQVLKNRYGMIILTFILVLLTAAVITYVMPKMYEAKALIKVNPLGKKTGTFGQGGIGSSGMTRQFFQTEFAIIKSEKVLKGAAEELQLPKRWKTSMKETIQILKGITNTRQERGTDLIEISVRHRKRTEVEPIVNAIIKSYERGRNSSIERLRADVLKKYKEKIQRQEDIVEDHRTQVHKLSTKLGIPYYGPGQAPATRTAETLLDIMKRKLEDMKTERDKLETVVSSLRGLDDESLIITLSASNRPEATVVKDLDARLKQLIQARADLIANGYGVNHPKVKSATAMIATTKAQLNKNVQQIRIKLGNDLVLMNKQIAKQEESIAANKDKVGITAEQRTQFGQVVEKYEKEVRLLDSLKAAEVTDTLTSDLQLDPIKVYDSPDTPEPDDYASPSWILNLALGAVAGLIFGVGIAFALEFMDTSVKSLEDVERYLQVPVLAVIPKDVGVLHKQAGASPDAEAYRILRTNIEFNRKNPDDNAITVVSGGAGEGKSTTLVNLAYICAQGGYSTLMIDADLRRPRLHTFFDINNRVGLTNYLTTDLLLEDVTLQTPIDNLFFMPSGILPADAAGILNSRRMSEMIQDVKQRFDLVLIDSPPILGVSDASVLASEVDLTMIVVQHRKLPKNMLLRVKQAVENVGGTVLGVVLNNVDVRSDSQYQYYTSYYTYYAPSELDRDKTTANAVDAPSASAEKDRPQSDDNDDLY